MNRYSYKELSELAGYTHRVFNMVQVMEELSKNVYTMNEDLKMKTEYLIDNIEGLVSYDYEGEIYLSFKPRL